MAINEKDINEFVASNSNLEALINLKATIEGRIDEIKTLNAAGLISKARIGQPIVFNGGKEGTIFSISGNGLVVTVPDSKLKRRLQWTDVDSLK